MTGFHIAKAFLAHHRKVIRPHQRSVGIDQQILISLRGDHADALGKQLDLLAKDEKPFFLAFGIIRPHLPFGCPAKYLEPYKDLKLPAIPHPEKPDRLSTWHGSGEFRKYNNFGKDI